MQKSGPWDPWLPVVKKSRLFAQRGHSARCAPRGALGASGVFVWGVQRLGPLPGTPHPQKKKTGAALTEAEATVNPKEADKSPSRDAGTSLLASYLKPQKLQEHSSPKMSSASSGFWRWISQLWATAQTLFTLLTPKWKDRLPLSAHCLQFGSVHRQVVQLPRAAVARWAQCGAATPLSARQDTQYRAFRRGCGSLARHQIPVPCYGVTTRHQPDAWAPAATPPCYHRRKMRTGPKTRHGTHDG